MNKSNNISAVIFDMDGLLVDSEPLWQKSEIAVFGTLGLDLTVSMCRQTMGLRIDEMVRYWYDRHPWELSKTLKETELNIIEELLLNIKQFAQPMKGVDTVMEFFKQKKLPLAVASSSPQRVIEEMMLKFELSNEFVLLRSAEHEAYGKPHPAVFINTALALEVDPSSCLTFEDSFNGLLSAKAARTKTVAIPDNENFSKTVFDIADLKLKSLSEFTQPHYDLLGHC